MTPPRFDDLSYDTMERATNYTTVNVSPQIVVVLEGTEPQRFIRLGPEPRCHCTERNSEDVTLCPHLAAAFYRARNPTIRAQFKRAMIEMPRRDKFAAEVARGVSECWDRSIESNLQVIESRLFSGWKAERIVFDPAATVDDLRRVASRMKHEMETLYGISLIPQMEILYGISLIPQAVQDREIRHLLLRPEGAWAAAENALRHADAGDFAILLERAHALYAIAVERHASNGGWLAAKAAELPHSALLPLLRSSSAGARDLGRALLGQTATLRAAQNTPSMRLRP